MYIQDIKDKLLSLKLDIEEVLDSIDNLEDFQDLDNLLVDYNIDCLIYKNIILDKKEEEEYYNQLDNISN